MEKLYNKSEKEILQTLKKIWKVEELIFIGKYQHSFAENEQEYGYISNVIANDRQVFYPKEVKKRAVSIRIKKRPDKDVGVLFSIQASLAPVELRRRFENPFLLLHKHDTEVVKENKSILPKDFIFEWFSKTGSTPKDAATIASQLKLNSLELYTQTERFIFELIQNADDMPASKAGVMVELHLLENFLLFKHNGKYFDRNDVKAIADAAQSNKAENVRQTGYKGIGFKSVFTDSTCVFIRSGSYSFKFDKMDPIYNDFRELYHWHINLLKNSPWDLEQFNIDYQNNKDKYDNIDNVPWQIKPIWVERNQFPEELLNSSFVKHSEVNIALEIGAETLKSKEYANMIERLLSKPRFILFLRNTKKFEFFILEDNNLIKKQEIELREIDEFIQINHNNENVATFSKSDFDLEINNEEFKKAGFSMERYEERPGVFKFKDEYGEIKSIPEKLGTLKSTRITFASQVTNNEIVKLDKGQSVLFNYLPTSDQRFGFPFLVNADFISNTSREFILKENKWNHYLFYHIGRKAIEWVAILGNVKDLAKEKRYFTFCRSYLNILPDALLDEENEELTAINCAFNRGIKQSIIDIPFIIDCNGDLRKCAEVIVDDTKVSKILGKNFFESIFITNKKLPFFLIQEDVLKKDYLGIEVFNASTFVAQLKNDQNKEILGTALLKVSHEKYMQFLIWLNDFAFISNNFDSSWCLDLPIVRSKKIDLPTIITIRDTFSKSDYIFRRNQTQNLEPVLDKLGFELSEFNLDDENLKGIKQAILQPETYLKSDLSLYNFIAAAKDFSKINSTEKNQLITFFAGLENVGSAKYAQSLALFKSKKINGNLKPLTNLISNKVEGLPDWLFDFVINEEEENALSLPFQKELLQKHDFLEKLFCNKDIFNEIISNINVANINDFYAYLLKLKDLQPEDSKINFSGIPWIFIESSKTFADATTVFWPESFLSLSQEQYLSVKSVIESISDEKLPHFSALKLKAPFSLGGKDVKLLSSIKRAGSFDTITANNFLDWAESNGENNYFTQITISEENGQYQFTPTKELVYYYTEDVDLINFIKGSDLDNKMNLLPKALFTSGRIKLGLLQGVSLIQYLLNNGQAVLSLSSFIQKQNNDSVSLQYLQLLPGLNIDTTNTYDQNSDEFKILKLVTQHLIKESDGENLKGFKAKITIDGHPLSEKAVSDDIIFYKDRKKLAELKTKLSEILPSYINKTYSITSIVNNFIDFKEDSNLIKIFKEEGRTTLQILNELKAQKQDYFTPVQTLFLSYYQYVNPVTEFFNDKGLFTKNNNLNQDIFEREILEFFDLCLKEDNYIGFVSQAIIPDFIPEMFILDSEFALEKEKIPVWQKKWSEEGDVENKKSFLKTLGINDETSPIVQFRKAIQESESEAINIKRELISNNNLLINTLQWLSEQQQKGKFELKKEVLQPLFLKLQYNNVPVTELRFPCIIKYGENAYSLEQINADSELHFINDGWGAYKQDIFSSLSRNKLITDDVISKVYRDAWKVLEKGYLEELDIKEIAENSESFDEEYYQEWEFNSKCNIFIYRGEKLPYLIKYHEIVIKDIEDNFVDRYNDNYYIVEAKKDLLFSLLDGILEVGLLNSLIAQSHKYSVKEKEKEKTGKIHFTEKESETWKKLFGNEIPSHYFKDINLAACVSALVMLSDEGYDLSQADVNLHDTHSYAQIEPVFKEGSSQELIIMCRSAIGGILYLTAQSWDRLDKEEVLLFVKTGKKDQDYQFFTGKQDVLSASDTRYQVFRVDAVSSVSTTDDILQGSFPKDKIWLILKMKESEQYKSIFEGNIRENEEFADFENVNTAEDGLY